MRATFEADEPHHDNAPNAAMMKRDARPPGIRKACERASPDRETSRKERDDRNVTPARP